MTSNLHHLPTYRRKFAAAEFKTTGQSTCSLVNGVTFVDGDQAPTTIMTYLKEHAAKGLVHLREIINRNGNSGDSWFQLVYSKGANGKDSSIGRSATETTFYIMLACNLYCQLEGNVEGMPLIEAINKTVTVEQADGKKIILSPSTCLQDKGAQLKVLAAQHAEVKRIIGGAQSFIDKDAPEKLKRYVLAVAACDNAVPKTMITTPLAILVQLAHTVAAMNNVLGSSQITLRTTTVSNASRVKLPVFLTNNKASVIKDLAVQYLNDDLISKQKAALDLKIADLFKFNTKAGSIDFADNLITTFVEKDCAFTFDTLIQFSALEHKFTTRFDSIPAAVQRKLAYKALKSEAVDSDLRTLSAVFLTHTPDDVMVSSLTALPELAAAVTADDNYLADVYNIVLTVINSYFRPLTFKEDLTGFNFRRSIINGRNLITRIERVAPPSSDYRLVSADIVGTGQTTKLYNFKIVDAAPSHVSVLDEFVNDTVFNGLSAVGKQGSVESGCALAFDGSQVHSIVEQLGFYTETVVDSVLHRVVITLRRYLSTIVPPTEGVDHISFGSTKRRDVVSTKFEVRPITEDSVLDELMAFPSELVLDATQEELEALYNSRLQELLGAPFDDGRVLYCKECGYSIRDALTLFVAGELSDSIEFGALRQTLFFPNKLKLDSFEKSLPEFVAVPKQVEYSIVMPADLLSYPVRNALDRIGMYVGVNSARGTVVKLFNPDFASSTTLKGQCTQATIEALKVAKTGLKFPNGVPYTHNVVAQIQINPYEAISFNTPVLKNRRDKKYVLRIDYGDAAMNNLVKNALVVLGRDGPCDLYSAFKRAPGIDPSRPRICNALEYAKNIVYSIIFSLNDYFSVTWVRDLCDLSVASAELGVLRDYLANYYADKLPLAALGLQTSGTVEDLIKSITDLDSAIKTADKEKIYTAAKAVADVLSPVGLATLSALALIVPTPVDAFSKGIMNMILTLEITFNKMPSVGAKLNGLVFGNMFLDQNAQTIYSRMIEAHFESAIISGVSKKGSTLGLTPATAKSDTGDGTEEVETTGGANE